MHCTKCLWKAIPSRVTCPQNSCGQFTLLPKIPRSVIRGYVSAGQFPPLHLVQVQPTADIVLGETPEYELGGK